MKIQSVAWKKGKMVLLDQTKLPAKVAYVSCSNVRQAREAIRVLKVRGAPAIGVAAAFGLVLGVNNKKIRNYAQLKKKTDMLFQYLASARPTAVNLVWALKRVKNVVLKNKHENIAAIKKLMLDEAKLISNEEIASCRKMADLAQGFIKDKDTILTYCNTGQLATVGLGTALSAVYRAKQLGKRIKVYACETRPLLQGARLTCWELKKNKVDVTLICDNMAGYLMQQGKIDKVFIGADRIAANGDSANKIGSYSLAVLARQHRVPFYVVAPHSTVDKRLAGGSRIPIEQRSGKEVSELFFKKPIALAQVKIYNPAFDVVPARLITAIVTDRTVLRFPYAQKIKRVF